MAMEKVVYFHDVGSSTTFSLTAIAPCSGLLTANVPVFLSSTVAADGTNYWTITAELNGTDITGTSLSNAATAFTAATDRTLVLTEQKVAAGDMLELVFTKASSATDLSAITIDAAITIVA